MVHPKAVCAVAATGAMALCSGAAFAQGARNNQRTIRTIRDSPIKWEGNAVRIISARKATREERGFYT